MKVVKESIAPIFDEIESIAKENYNEAKFYDYYGDIHLNKEKFIALEDMNALKFFSFRDDETNKLVGYSYYMCIHSMLGNALFAENGAFFLLPKYRKGLTANLLLADIEKILNKDKVQLIIHRTSIEHDCSVLFERAGFEFKEKVYVKRI